MPTLDVARHHSASRQFGRLMMCFRHYAKVLLSGTCLVLRPWPANMFSLIPRRSSINRGSQVAGPVVASDSGFETWVSFCGRVDSTEIGSPHLKHDENNVTSRIGIFVSLSVHAFLMVRSPAGPARKDSMLLPFGPCALWVFLHPVRPRVIWEQDFMAPSVFVPGGGL